VSASNDDSTSKTGTLTTEEDSRPWSSGFDEGETSSRPASDSVVCAKFLRKIAEIRRKQSSRPG